jgi:hypothetical protein
MLQPTVADGTEIRAADEGSGPAVLVVPPDMDDGTSWQRVAALLIREHAEQVLPAAESTA